MGYEQSQLLGRPMEDLVSPARRQIFNEALAATFSGHPVDNLDFRSCAAMAGWGSFR